MDINSERLKALRDEQPWSQDELATAAGLSLRTIQRAEREGVASLQTVKAIAAALNVDSSLIRATAVKSENIGAEATSTAKPESFHLKWRFGLILGLLLLVLVGPLVVVISRTKDSPRSGDSAITAIPSRTDATPLAEKVLGHWESSSTGTLTTLDLDGTMTNPGGDVRGNARYSILGDVISFGFNNRIVAARVTFDSPTEMVWTTVETGTVIRYTRSKIVLPSREEVFASIKGNWNGVGEAKSLEVREDQLKLVLVDGTLINTAYIINGLQISMNRAGIVQRFAISINSREQMTWTKVYTPEKYVFIRSKP